MNWEPIAKTIQYDPAGLFVPIHGPANAKSSDNPQPNLIVIQNISIENKRGFSTMKLAISILSFSMVQIQLE
jgi:hypothetical protein